jgi:hypothetical protein
MFDSLPENIIPEIFQIVIDPRILACFMLVKFPPELPIDKKPAGPKRPDRHQRRRWA